MWFRLKVCTVARRGWFAPDTFPKTIARWFAQTTRAANLFRSYVWTHLPPYIPILVAHANTVDAITLGKGSFVSHGMKGWNKSGLDSFNNYYKFWRFGINSGPFQQKWTGPKFCYFPPFITSVGLDFVPSDCMAACASLPVGYNFLSVDIRR
jgi:hypothetical protein